MAEFTGLGAGIPPKGGGITPAKVAVWGATAGLGYEAVGWLDYQRQRYQNWRSRNAPAPEEEQDDPEFIEAVKQITFGLLDDMVAMTESMEKGTGVFAGPVEEWDGDLATNIRFCQYIEKLSPAAFAAWRARNYSK